MYYNDYLAHYGVKGMKWGVRRKRQRADRNRWKSMSKSERAANRDSLNPRYKKLDREIDTDLYGERGVQRINRRMNKGQSHLRATTTEAARRAQELIPKLVSDNSMNNVIKLKKNQYKVW